jgi:hypothetical protein
MCQLSFLEYQRIADIFYGLIWFIAGAIFTVVLDKWRYRKARPTARAALESRLYYIARVLVLSVGILLRKSDAEIKNTIFDFSEDHLVFIFEQTEKLIDIYGHLMPINVQESLRKLGDEAGYLADDVVHVKVNFDMVDELDEWKELRPRLTSLVNDFDELVIKLTKHGFLSNQFSDHWNSMKTLLSTPTNHKPPKG